MNKILVNGCEQSVVEASDRGLHYGDGLFETIACKNGQLQLWDEHMQRLRQSSERLSIAVVDESVWLKDIDSLNLSENAVVKLIVTRGTSGRGYAYANENTVSRVCAAYNWPEYAGANQNGITARMCDTPVSMNAALAGMKHLNRLDNVLARNEWHGSDIVEGFMLDQNQHVIEGTMSNVFCVLDNVIYTPSLEYSGVNGVMRQHVMTLAESNNMSINTINISRKNFLNMDSIFITNSLLGIWPVTKIITDNQQYEYSVAESIKLLQARLNDSLKA